MNGKTASEARAAAPKRSLRRPLSRKNAATSSGRNRLKTVAKAFGSLNVPLTWPMLDQNSVFPNPGSMSFWASPAPEATRSAAAAAARAFIRNRASRSSGRTRAKNPIPVRMFRATKMTLIRAPPALTPSTFTGNS